MGGAVPCSSGSLNSFDENFVNLVWPGASSVYVTLQWAQNDYYKTTSVYVFNSSV